MREFRINDITIGIEELFESMPVAMALIDREGRHVALNQALASFSGRNAKELVGKKVSENSKESAENIKRDFAAFDEGESIPNHELQMGDRVYLVSVKPLRDSAGAAVAEMVVLTDITKNKQTERELAEANRRLDFLASRDPLTGILNARTYYEVCEKLMNAALREKENFSLLFIDIDHFKRINDTYGHDVGDIVLKKVSSCIANTVRSSDVAGRVGGEEFSLYLPNSDLSGALDLAEKLRKTIESLEIKNGKDLLPVTVSIGAASHSAHHKSIADIQRDADHAMYHAKNSGRNRVAFLDMPCYVEKNVAEEA
ncbi:MAG TPA: GGDEF domain-containing protein [Spirochaetota bacterium]|nr:GGDEF domain-containing protein [Spirochaetota bacterium]HPK57673.1 GGDEF domain-containing protein [Spirochaetota bacterium]